MKTRIAFLACAVAIGASVGLNGCASNRASVQIQAICFPTSDCTFSSACQTYFGGTAGIVGTGALVLYLQVANNLPNNENLSINRLNTNDAHVDETVVEFEGVQSDTQTTPTNSYIPAGGSTVVPVALGITAAGSMVAKLRLKGYYDDGTKFETGEFRIAVFAGAAACDTTTCATATSTCPPGGAGQCPVACSTTNSTTGYTIGGTVSGLTASGLILSSPGLADLSVPAGATTFQFAGTVPSGGAYDVTVRQQPTGQTCTVTFGSGTAGANVSSIFVTCA